MYNQTIGNQTDNNNQNQLSIQFFERMSEAEHKYLKKRDEESMRQLLNYYTDCVNYFQIKQQAISQYFQIKIKQLVKQVKQFGTQELADKNKEKMNKNIIRAMQQQNIQDQIAKTMKKDKKIGEMITKNINDQYQKLQKRLDKTKRTMNKCFSVTSSFVSIESSPEKKLFPKDRIPLGLTQKFLFTKEIGYSDQENSTT